MLTSRRWPALALAALGLGFPLLAQGPTAGAATSFLGGLKGSTSVATTVPANGDVNPYGVAVVSRSVGDLVKGDILVSNFNNAPTTPNPGGQQGTGHTIVELPPGGHPAKAPAHVFANIDPNRVACPGGVGLTTALTVLPSGWVVVGSLPTADGTSATARAGCLIVLNSRGAVVRTIAGGLINGPWDMTGTQVGDDAFLFVTNVLNGITAADNANNTVVNQGTVVRVVLDLSSPRPRVDSETVIASGFPERTDPAALVIGPTGVGLGFHGDVLYVADTLGNRITAIPAPFSLPRPVFGAGFTVSGNRGLNGPLGLTVAPNGDIVTVNSVDGNAVETTPSGTQVAVVPLDSTLAPPALPGAGTLFGVALAPGGHGLYFVDDGTNTLDRLG
jgi:hypothetical protein